MKTLSGLKLVTFLSLGLLILSGCYSGTEETADVAQIEQLTREELSGKIEIYLAQLEEAGFSGAVLVAQNGEVIFEGGYGLADRKNEIPITPATVFDTGSLSKQFTAAAILHLEQQGKLQVKDTLAKFFDIAIPNDS